MTALTTISAAPTMTSLELVEFINADRKARADAAGETFPSKGFAELAHSDFMKKVPEVLGPNHGNFSDIYRDARNRNQACYRFPKREACLMAMSYSYELQAKVFDRMTALESAATPALPSYTEALRQLADQIERNEQQAQAIALAAPAVAAQALLAGADGALCITNAAKALKVRPKDLFAWLSSHGWIYRRTGGAGWLGYQARLQSGHLEHKLTTVERTDGTEKVTEQVRVTAKGMAKLAEVFGSGMDKEAA